MRNLGESWANWDSGYPTYLSAAFCFLEEAEGSGKGQQTEVKTMRFFCYPDNSEAEKNNYIFPIN